MKKINFLKNTNYFLRTITKFEKRKKNGKKGKKCVIIYLKRGKKFYQIEEKDKAFKTIIL